MQKVVINSCFGGFGLSEEAKALFIKLAPNHPNYKNGVLFTYNIERHDPILIQVVEELGTKANGECAELEIVKVFGDYYIEQYDGIETLVYDYDDL